MSMMVSFVLSFFPRDVLDEILNLIESVSEDFPSYNMQTIVYLNIFRGHGLVILMVVFGQRSKMRFATIKTTINLPIRLILIQVFQFLCIFFTFFTFQRVIAIAFSNINLYTVGKF